MYFSTLFLFLTAVATTIAITVNRHRQSLYRTVINTIKPQGPFVDKLKQEAVASAKVMGVTVVLFVLAAWLVFGEALGYITPVVIW